MTQIPLKDFLNRVLTSQEHIHFSYIDPYGHLNASKYLEFFLNHRIAAAEKQLACFTVNIARELGVGFVIQNVNLKFLSPVYQGEIVEIGSWLTHLSDSGFRVEMTMISNSKRKLKALAFIDFVSVDAKTGAAIRMPVELPSQSEKNLIMELPHSSQYTETITNYRKDVE